MDINVTIFSSSSFLRAWIILNSHILSFPNVRIKDVTNREFSIFKRREISYVYKFSVIFNELVLFYLDILDSF